MRTAAQQSFEEFCALRRQKIAAAFVAWSRDIATEIAIPECIEAEPRPVLKDAGKEVMGRQGPGGDGSQKPQPRIRGWEGFLGNARKRLDEQSVGILAEVYQRLQPMGLQISWGRGTTIGSFNVKCRKIHPKSFITIQSNGVLYFNAPWYKGTAEAEGFRDHLKEALVREMGLSIPEDYQKRFCPFDLRKWGERRNTLIEILQRLLANYQKASTSI